VPGFCFSLRACHSTTTSPPPRPAEELISTSKGAGRIPGWRKSFQVGARLPLSVPRRICSALTATAITTLPSDAHVLAVSPQQTRRSSQHSHDISLRDRRSPPFAVACWPTAVLRLNRLTGLWLTIISQTSQITIKTRDSVNSITAWSLDTRSCESVSEHCSRAAAVLPPLAHSLARSPKNFLPTSDVLRSMAASRQ
jgi:hypothetical protein